MRKVFAYLLLLFPYVLSCSRGEGLYRDTRVIMGTYVTITASVEGVGEEAARKAVARAFEQVSRVDRLMSTYKPDSELSRVNRNAGVAPVRVDPEVVQTVADAVKVAEMTGGAFDPTIGPVVKLWGIGGEHPKVPDRGELSQALALVGYRGVVVDRAAGTVYLKKKGMYLDLGGIAKGYASDLAVDELRKAGIRSGIVSVAGDIKLFGRRPDGSRWRVGIQHPRQKDGVLGRFEMDGGAVSTSGDYERFFVKDGVRYHHILDPKTGFPAKGAASVTVVSDKSWLSDALATGIFVMGPEKGYRLAKARPEAEVLLVTDRGEVFATGRFSRPGIVPARAFDKNQTW